MTIEGKAQVVYKMAYNQYTYDMDRYLDDRSFKKIWLYGINDNSHSKLTGVITALFWAGLIDESCFDKWSDEAYEAFKLYEGLIDQRKDIQDN